MAVMAGVFLLDTATPITDSYPDIKPGSDEFTVAIIYCEVVGMFALMNMLACCPAPLGNLMAWLALDGMFVYHITQRDKVPPLPIMAINGVVTLMCLKDVLAPPADSGKKKA